MQREQSRTSLLLALALPLGLVLGACGGGESETPAGTESAGPAALEPARDTRLAYLLVPCAHGGYYGVSTADVTAILEETLLHGQRDPLRRAKGELGEMGDAGLPVLRRVVQANWNVPDGKNHVRNALEAAAMGSTPAARELLLEGLEHPVEDLRLVSLRGLRKHGLPSDYDALFEALAQASTPFYPQVVATMYDVAPVPSGALILGWLERGEYASLWPSLVPLLASVQDPELLERCRALWPQLDPHFKPMIAAPCARAGDPDALRALDGWLVDADNPNLRLYTATALDEAELFERLSPMLAEDPVPQNRLLAAGFMAETPARVRAVRAQLTAGTGDESNDVRLACLLGLVSINDPGAIDAALLILQDTGPDSLRDGMRLLRGPMAGDRALAERVLEVLLRRDEEDALRPLPERMKVLQTLGHVPLEAAALHLFEQSQLAEGVQLQGRRPEQWFLLQIGNVGPVAHPFLESLLDEPWSEVRRIDVLEALSMGGGEPARASMLRFLEREDARPFEVLYAAERLVRLGPARVVAPVLKRVALRITDRQVRPALQCLLWVAYPGPE